MSKETETRTTRRPLRLWPGVVAALTLLVAWFGMPLGLLPPEVGIPVTTVAGVVCALLIFLWWAFLSRLPRWERWGAILLIAVAMAATSRLIHESIANGMMGLMFIGYGLTTVSVALVAWAVAWGRLPDGPRRVTMIATILLACGAWTLVRTEGVTGAGSSQFAWRWTKTPEERLLARAGDQRVALPPAPVKAERSTQPLAKAGGEPADLPVKPAAATTVSSASSAIVAGSYWPGFRGLARDGIVRDVRIATDWSRFPPVELWRRPIGPGWSSFAVRGDRLYTQEQRGDAEVVACYNATTGKPIWAHRDAVRFWESNGGAGPRATPTLSEGRVYAFGATGILNALDADDGSVVWSRNVVTDTGAKVPYWGFSSSPLVTADTVIVHAGSLVAYDRTTGNMRWDGEAKGASYSSPHLVTIDGVPQILQMSAAGVTSVAVSDGTRLWEHSWEGATIVQPAVIGDHDLLISVSGAAGGIGIRRIAVALRPGGWTVEERWTSNGLKPYFNDFVVHKGHAFGFDGNILACIDLQDGRRKWKGGRYGNGQMVLLRDEDVLLVLSEDGELALVAATPDQFTELARFPALEGKTWNHPAVVGGALLVRNGQEMAAFRLSLAPER